MELDIVRAIQSLATDFWDVIMLIFSFFGEVGFFVVVFVLLFWCYDKRFAFKFAAVFGAVSVLSWGLKEIFMRPRPYTEAGVINYTNTSGYSMPSGHSAAIAVIAGTLAYEAQKARAKWFRIFGVIILVLLCLCVGLSRIYLGQHYLSDVLVGWALGFAVSLVMFKFVKFDNKEHIYALFLLPFLVFAYLMFADTLATSNFRAGEYAVIFMMAIGIILGYFFEKRFVNYTPAKVWWFELIKIFGFGGACIVLWFLCIWFLPNLVFYRSISALFCMLIAMVLCPYIFKKIEKKFLRKTA